MTDNKIERGVDLYVILTLKTNADGTPLTGNWRGTNWINGVSLYVYSKDEAIKMRQAGLANDIKKYKTIRFKEIEKWSLENNLEAVPPTSKYVTEDDSDNFVMVNPSANSY